jgi:hypothetical protein
MPSDLRDGRKPGWSGRVRVPASHSARRAGGEANGTSDISGPTCDVSSPSAILQSCLENRLRANLDASGSPEYVLTWKHWDIPSGPPICALRASVPRTSGSDSTGWPSPKARDRGRQGRRTPNPGGGNSNLDEQTFDLLLTGWASPAGRDWKSDRGEKTDEQQYGSRGRPLARQALGVEQGASSAPTEGGDGSLMLNPAFVRWLMGFPPGWDDCAVTAMRSCRSLQRSSSGRSSKRRR